MAAAIPLAVGLAAGGITYAAVGGANALMWAMTAGMIAMTIAQMLMAPEVKQPKSSSADYELQEYTARADNVSLPRAYGTVGAPANLVWYGNFFYLETRASQSESRVY